MVRYITPLRNSLMHITLTYIMSRIAYTARDHLVRGMDNHRALLNLSQQWKQRGNRMVTSLYLGLSFAVNYVSRVVTNAPIRKIFNVKNKTYYTASTVKDNSIDTDNAMVLLLTYLSKSLGTVLFTSTDCILFAISLVAIIAHCVVNCLVDVVCWPLKTVFDISKKVSKNLLALTAYVPNVTIRLYTKLSVLFRNWAIKTIAYPPAFIISMGLDLFTNCAKLIFSNQHLFQKNQTSTKTEKIEHLASGITDKLNCLSFMIVLPCTIIGTAAYIICGSFLCLVTTPLSHLSKKMQQLTKKIHLLTGLQILSSNRVQICKKPSTDHKRIEEDVLIQLESIAKEFTGIERHEWRDNATFNHFANYILLMYLLPSFKFPIPGSKDTSSFSSQKNIEKLIRACGGEVNQPPKVIGTKKDKGKTRSYTDHQEGDSGQKKKISDYYPLGTNAPHQATESKILDMLKGSLDKYAAYTKTKCNLISTSDAVNIILSLYVGVALDICSLYREEINQDNEVKRRKSTPLNNVINEYKSIKQELLERETDTLDCILMVLWKNISKSIVFDLQQLWFSYSRHSKNHATKKSTGSYKLPKTLCYQAPASLGEIPSNDSISAETPYTLVKNVNGEVHPSSVPTPEKSFNENNSYTANLAGKRLFCF